MHRLRSHSTLFWATGEATTSRYSPRDWRSGQPRMHGLHTNSALFWGPREGKAQVATSDYSLRFALGTPQNAKDT